MCTEATFHLAVAPDEQLSRAAMMSSTAPAASLIDQFPTRHTLNRPLAARRLFSIGYFADVHARMRSASDTWFYSELVS